MVRKASGSRAGGPGLALILGVQAHRAVFGPALFQQRHLGHARCQQPAPALAEPGLRVALAAEGLLRQIPCRGRRPVHPLVPPCPRHVPATSFPAASRAPSASPGSERPQAMPIISRLARPAAHRRPPGRLARPPSRRLTGLTRKTAQPLGSPGWARETALPPTHPAGGSRHGPAAGPPGPGPPAAIADIAITGTVTNGGMSADPGFNVERPEPGSPTVLGFNPPALRPHAGGGRVTDPPFSDQGGET